MRTKAALFIVAFAATCGTATSVLSLDLGKTVGGVTGSVTGAVSGVTGGSSAIDHTITGSAGPSKSLGDKQGSVIGSYTHPDSPLGSNKGKSYTEITKIEDNKLYVLSGNEVNVLNFEDIDILSGNKILSDNEKNKFFSDNKFVTKVLNGNFSHNKITFNYRGKPCVVVIKDEHHHPKPGHEPKDGMKTASSAHESNSSPLSGLDCDAWKAYKGTRQVDIGEYERHCLQPQ